MDDDTQKLQRERMHKYINVEETHFQLLLMNKFINPKNLFQFLFWALGIC